MSQATRLALVILVLVYGFLLVLRAQVWHGAGIDENSYYAQGASLVWDHDLHLLNDFMESRQPYVTRQMMIGQIFFRNSYNMGFSIGPSMLGLPVLGSLHLLLPEIVDRHHYYHRVGWTFITWLGVLIGLMTSHRLASRYVGDWRALILVLLFFLGTNLCYYTWYSAGMSHGLSFMAMALATWAAIRFGECPSRFRAILAGAFTGLAFLIRWQDALIVILPLGVGWNLWRTYALPQRRILLTQYLPLFILGGFILALPQIAAWYLYTGAITPPHGAGFFERNFGRLSLVLLSPYNGWLYTHPIAALFLVIGLSTFWFKRDSSLIPFLLVIGGTWVLNAAAGDWWAGGSFGARRFVGLGALLIFLAAKAIPSTPRIVTITLFVLSVFLLIPLNFLLVTRGGHEFVYPIFWSAIWENASAWLHWPLSNYQFWLTSDLFIPPDGVRVETPIVPAFLLAALMVQAISISAIFSENLLHLLPGKKQLTILALLLYPLCLSVVILTRPPAATEEDFRWNDATVDLRARNDMPQLSTLISEYLTKHPGTLASRVTLLEVAIASGEKVVAQAVSEELLSEYPRTVMEVWMKESAPDDRQRREFVEAALHLTDPAISVAEQAYYSILDFQDPTRLDFLHVLAGGPEWRSLLRIFHRQQIAMSDPDALREILTTVARLYPVGAAQVPLEQLRLESDPAKQLQHFDQLQRIAEQDFAVARHLTYRHPFLEFLGVARSSASFELLATARFWIGDQQALMDSLRHAATIGISSNVIRPFREKIPLFNRLNTALKEANPRLGSALRPTPSLVMAGCPASELLTEDGWYLRDGEAASRTRTSYIRLDAPLQPGKYRLHLVGKLAEHPRLSTDLQVDFYGTSTRGSVRLPNGDFHVAIELELTQPLARPILRFAYPTFRVRFEADDVVSRQRVGFVFIDTWLVKAP